MGSLTYRFPEIEFDAVNSQTNPDNTNTERKTFVPPPSPESTTAQFNAHSEHCKDRTTKDDNDKRTRLLTDLKTHASANAIQSLPPTTPSAPTQKKKWRPLGETLRNRNSCHFNVPYTIALSFSYPNHPNHGAHASFHRERPREHRVAHQAELIPLS